MNVRALSIAAVAASLLAAPMAFAANSSVPQAPAAPAEPTAPAAPTVASPAEPAKAHKEAVRKETSATATQAPAKTQGSADTKAAEGKHATTPHKAKHDDLVKTKAGGAPVAVAR